MFNSQENFKNQFDSLDKYNVIKYYTKTYEESGLQSLIQQINRPVVAKNVKILRQGLDDSYKAAILDYQRASRMLTIYSQYMTDEQRNIIKDIREKALNNSTVFTEAAVYCYDNPYGTDCIDNTATAKASVQDYEDKRNYFEIF